MATRSKSIRDLFEQMERLTVNTKPQSYEEKVRNMRRNNLVRNLADRYRDNIKNALERDGIKLDENALDIKYDKEVYTRASKSGSST